MSPARCKNPGNFRPNLLPRISAIASRTWHLLVYPPTAARSVLADNFAVLTCFSHANGRPSIARFSVFSNTREKTCRYVNRWIQM